jgi:hypothetical protein
MENHFQAPSRQYAKISSAPRHILSIQLKSRTGPRLLSMQIVQAQVSLLLRWVIVILMIRDLIIVMLTEMGKQP